MTKRHRDVKKCPFCGSDNLTIERCDKGTVYVLCLLCAAQGGYSRKKKEAIVFWNNRLLSIETAADVVDMTDQRHNILSLSGEHAKIERAKSRNHLYAWCRSCKTKFIDDAPQAARSISHCPICGPDKSLYRGLKKDLLEQMIGVNRKNAQAP